MARVVFQSARSKPSASEIRVPVEDTDSDGLPCCVEIQGALSGFQYRYTSDPLVADTDGDGLTDPGGVD